MTDLPDRHKTYLFLVDGCLLLFHVYLTDGVLTHTTASVCNQEGLVDLWQIDEWDEDEEGDD